MFDTVEMSAADDLTTCYSRNSEIISKHIAHVSCSK